VGELVTLQTALATVGTLVSVALDDGCVNRLTGTVGAPVNVGAQVVALREEKVVHHGQLGATLGVGALHGLL